MNILRTAAGLFFLINLSYIHLNGQVCPTESIETIFRSQADILTFAEKYPDCTELQHTLNISGSVTDLSPLNNIEIINGRFQIQFTDLSLIHI